MGPGLALVPSRNSQLNTGGATVSEENKALVRTYLEAYTNGDLETCKNMMADNHQFHFPFADAPMDKENHADAMSMFKAAIPDLRFTTRSRMATR